MKTMKGAGVWRAMEVHKTVFLALGPPIRGRLPLNDGPCPVCFELVQVKGGRGGC